MPDITPQTQPPPPGIPPEHVAVIAAAVVATLGAGAQVRSVVRATPGPRWAWQGRAKLMGSRRPSTRQSWGRDAGH